MGGIKHTYTLDGAKILREQWVEGEDIKREITPLYDNEDNVCGILHCDIPYYFLKNLQGDVIAITNQRGETVARYTYDAWGACTVSYDATATPADEDAVAINIATVNPFRYRSYYFDTETGLYYLQSRYYNPKIGRFLNGDVYASTGQGVIGFNMFSYCNNNPVNGVDATGDCSWFFGKRDCGKTTCKNSKYYIERRVAVIYDGRTSGYLFGRFGGEGFAHQGKELVKRLSKSFTVTSYTFRTIHEFVDCWNSLSGKYDAIYILGHGQPGKLNSKGGSLMPRGGTYSYSHLKKVESTDLFLYICNGATPNDSGISTAKCFARLTGATVHAVAYGKMNFSWYNCVPELASGVWVKIRV